MVSLISGLEMRGIAKWKGLKSQGPLYGYTGNNSPVAKKSLDGLLDRQMAFNAE